MQNVSHQKNTFAVRLEGRLLDSQIYTYSYEFPAVSLEHCSGFIVSLLRVAVEHAILYLEGWWFEPWLLQSACQSILELDTESQIALMLYLECDCWIEST